MRARAGKPSKIRCSCSPSAVCELTWSHAFFRRAYESDARIRGKRGGKKGYDAKGGTRAPEHRRRKRMLLVRIHASVGPARCGRARNIKVSNYNARHDTSFRPSSIKSHETPGGGHRYRVICAPVATDYLLEEMSERERERRGEKERKRANLLSNIQPWASSRHCTIGRINAVRSVCHSQRDFMTRAIHSDSFLK